LATLLHLLLILSEDCANSGTCSTQLAGSLQDVDNQTLAGLFARYWVKYHKGQKMKKTFYTIALMSVISGCAAPKPVMMQSSTQMVVYRYITSDSLGIGDSQKAAESYCKENGMRAELESIKTMNEYTSLATFRCVKA
jgi:hypothetical protein